MTFTTAAISAAGSARRIHSISDIEVRIPAAVTGGVMSIFETFVVADDGPPMHIHSREDELFYVLDGTFQFWCGDETIVGGPGTTVVLPRNIPHRYHNVGVTEGRLLVAVTPGGFEDFFLDIANEQATEPPAVIAIAARYGLTILPPKSEVA